MEFNYCPLCAAALIKPVEGFPHCPKGHFTQYPSVLTGVAALVLMDGNLLLEQRAIEPGYGRWGIYPEG